MRAVIVDKSGAVISAVELQAGFDDPASGRAYWQPPEGCSAILSDEAGIGWTFDGTAFMAPPSGPDTDPSPAPPPPRDLAAEFDALKDALIRANALTQFDIDVAAALAKPLS